MSRVGTKVGSTTFMSTDTKKLTIILDLYGKSPELRIKGSLVEPCWDTTYVKWKLHALISEFAGAGYDVDFIENK